MMSLNSHGGGIDRELSRQARHSRWTEPGTFVAQLETLPPEARSLAEIVGGLVLHPLFARNGQESAEPQLRGVTEIIGAVLAKDEKPLVRARPPEARVLGTCRTYALLACAILRQHRTPARLRVGFADYFTPSFWEDHWVCEYHDGERWKLLDAELTGEIRRRFGVSFDTADVPRDRFLAAGPAWQALRRGDVDPARFGVSAIGIAGMWFAASSLLRDLAALNREEMMPWDFWGPARDFRPGADIAPDWLTRLDHLSEGLARLDSGRKDAASILAEHAWATLEPSVLSFPQRQPLEVTLAA